MYVDTITEINRSNIEVMFYKVRFILFSEKHHFECGKKNRCSFSPFPFSLCQSFNSSTLSPAYLDVLFLFHPSIPHSLASPRAFILAGCFLYENTPIGRQAPLSDTIHCTCIDMKNVLTSTAEFCDAAESAYQWQCRSCDQIKAAEKFWRQLCWYPCQTLKFHCSSFKVESEIFFAFLISVENLDLEQQQSCDHSFLMLFSRFKFGEIHIQLFLAVTSFI